MNISAPFIRRPIGTALLGIGLMVAGILSYRALPVAPIPSIPVPAIVVDANQPGADPATMASTIAAPLEREIGHIPGIDDVTSINATGASTVIILFSVDRDINGAAHDVQAAINAAIPNLPSDLPARPYYREFNPASRPVLTIALTSKTRDIGDIYDSANTILAQRLAQVPGVAQVQLDGGQSPAVRIRTNPASLAAAGLTAADVYQAVRTANSLAPLGAIEGADQSTMLAVNGQLHNAAAYRSIILKSSGKTILRLGDVAQVVDGVANTRLAASDGLQPAILVTITKTPFANVIKTVDGVKRVLPQVEKFLPADIKLSILTDRTTTIRASVADIQLTMGITIALVLAVVLIFMGRIVPTIAAFVTVPLSIAGTLAGMWALNFSLDNFSLMALTISVGFVVDDAIVMIENIVTQHERGLTGIEAAMTGARQIGFTVLSITISLVVVFVPLTLMPGLLGKLFFEFAMTLTLAIIASGIVSLTVTPMICAHFMAKAKPVTAQPGLSARFLAGFERLYRRVLAAYETSLDWSLLRPRLMLALTVLTVIITVFLYVEIPKSFLPEEDTGLIIGNSIAAPDVSFTQMQKLQRQVVNILLHDPAIATVSSRIGGNEGDDTINRGHFFIGLKPLSQRGISAQKIIDRLRPQLAKLTGIETYLQAAQDLFSGGKSTNGEYDFAVLTPSLSELGRATALIEAKLKALHGIKDVSSDQDKPQPQINVEIDRNAAARLGVSIAAIDAALDDSFAQRQISKIYDSQNQYEVVLDVRADLQKAPNQLDHVFVPGTNGAIPLTAVAHFTRGTVPLIVTHQNAMPAATISFNVSDGASLGTAIGRVKAAIAGIELPANVQIQFGGNAKYFLQSVQAEPTLIVAALGAIYIVLGVLYESLTQPLTILSTLPSAGVGALLALLITGLPLSIIAIIGIFLLMGIVKKNGIMLIDFALEAERKRGVSPHDAIRAACLERFRPIMMTTIAAILGALPLAFAVGTGYQLRQPLGVAVIGGLIVCQALTLYTTPSVYLALSGFGKRRARRIRSIPVS
ncbi:MAG TPA: efflux RND transporter permease subunit [Acetobacteraceae bacterium]|nr:efflux RND transporter permease subunit [Acetobacteraceae bacterium]